jgi:O-antigen ligase
MNIFKSITLENINSRAFGKMFMGFIFIQAFIMFSFLFKAKTIVFALLAIFVGGTLLYNPLAAVVLYSFLAPAHQWFGEAVGQRLAFLLPVSVEISLILRYLVKSNTTYFRLEKWMLFPCLLFLVIISLSILLNGAEGIVVVLSGIMRYAQLFIIPLFMPSIIDSFSKLKTLFVVIILSALLSLIPDIRLLLSGQPGRVMGFSLDPNFFAMFIVMVLPILYCFILNSRNIFVKVLGICSALVLLTALIGTLSRGGIIALFIVFLFIILRSERKKLLILSGLVSVILLFVIVPRNKWLAFTDIERMTSVATRQGVQRAGWEMLKGNLWLGVGPGKFEERVYGFAKYSKSLLVVRNIKWSLHNNYLDIAVTMGILGFVSYALILFMTIIYTERARRRFKKLQNQNMVVMTTGLQAGLLGFLVASAFLTAFTFGPFWIYWGICGVLYSLSISAERGKEFTQEFKIAYGI